MWDKKFTQTDRKKFLHLIDYIIEAIDSGKLKSGDSLPTQRELSRKLNLSIGTITKAFKELEKLGYLNGEIGRGTFVRDISVDYSDFWYSEEKVPYKFNLGHFRTTELFNYTIQLSLIKSIREVANDPTIYFKLNDSNNCGSPSQKEVVKEWLATAGFKDLSLSNISLMMSEVSTVQYCITALTSEGDNIILEHIGDRITRDQVAGSGRNILTVAMDDEGIIPDELEYLLKKHEVKLLITMPTMHNPTCITTPLNRKREIASLCEKYNVIIIEDGKTDLFYGSSINPYMELTASHALYLMGTYFHLNPALNNSFLLGNPELVRKIEAQFKRSYWAVSQLSTQITLDLIISGRATRIIEDRKKLLQSRNMLFNSTFNISLNKMDQNVVLRWLKLPEHWSSSHFTQVAYENGILIRNSDIFAIDESLKLPYVRICNAAINNEKQYEAALIELKSLMDEPSISL